MSVYRRPHTRPSRSLQSTLSGWIADGENSRNNNGNSSNSLMSFFSGSTRQTNGSDDKTKSNEDFAATDSFGASGTGDDTQNKSPESNFNATPFPMQPKHIQFPDVPYNEIINELMMFVYSVFATALQFLNLYRTVWWLPESNTNQTMNFYLIDGHLTMFIVILLGRRLVYCFLMKAVELLCPKKIQQSALTIIKFTFFAAFIVITDFLCYQMVSKHQYIVIYLCYPLVLYAITFGMNIEPFLRTIFSTNAYLNGIPTHSCSTNPATIRAEIEMLRSDYNNRIKQALFTSFLNAYYATFIPCCFAQNFLHYDLYWATQHLVFFVLGSFTMCMTVCFPANYCDVLHMSSLHLGKWTKVESRSYVPPAVAWSKLVSWPPGALVKHSGEMYKSCGAVTTAMPGNGTHARFYMFFQNPANLYLILAMVQSILIVLQMIVLFTVVEWHNIISLSYLLLANFHTLFRIVRDFFVTHRIYTSEINISSMILN